MYFLDDLDEEEYEIAIKVGYLTIFLPLTTKWGFWSLDLLEAIQGIAFQCQKTSSCHLLNFSVFRHVFISSLDMYKNCIDLYHIDSEQV